MSLDRSQEKGLPNRDGLAETDKNGQENRGGKNTKLCPGTPDQGKLISKGGWAVSGHFGIVLWQNEVLQQCADV